MTKDEAQLEQEPVAWGFHIQFNNGKDATFKGLDKLAEFEAHLEYGETITLLHTGTPQRPWVMQREWVDLTDEEIDKWAHELHGVIYAVMAELKEKNNG